MRNKRLISFGLLLLVTGGISKKRARRTYIPIKVR